MSMLTFLKRRHDIRKTLSTLLRMSAVGAESVDVVVAESRSDAFEVVVVITIQNRSKKTGNFRIYSHALCSLLAGTGVRWLQGCTAAIPARNRWMARYYLGCAFSAFAGTIPTLKLGTIGRAHALVA
ncbi:hypothetical protein BDZ89DRAFT_1054259 [Hymenopellis radicata]|nr:hypothetical protein BDZ89DRAFT_1054259 [Hymenopellis radicata]